jgi:hypothetical protein
MATPGLRSLPLIGSFSSSFSFSYAYSVSLPILVASLEFQNP